LTTDGSKGRLGAVLEQVTKSGKKVVISYASRSLTPAEQNYSPTHLEGLVVVWAIRHYRHYLWGHHFILQTNHITVLSLFRTSEPLNGRLARWQLLLMEYDYDIIHIHGKTNPADYLSRHPTTTATTCKD
jgi:hypothetical protein